MQTELDKAHAAMEVAPESDAARLAFYARLADCELFLLLKHEAEGEAIEPEGAEIEGISYVFGFDAEERLVEFAAQAAPYAVLSGRALAGLLNGQGVGLGVNAGVAPSSILLPPEAVAWLAETLAGTPEEDAGALAAVRPPELAEAVLAALEAKLARAGGLVRAACLAGVTYGDGREGHLLAFLDAVPEAEAALAKAVSEALVFSGLEEGALDVAFFAGDAPLAARLAAVGLRFDLPEPAAEEVQVPGAAPGMDKGKPPILK